MTKKLSASRLNDFLGCAHHAALWLDGIKPPDANNPSLDLLRSKGFEHEAKVLKRLEMLYGPAVSIPDKASLETRVAETLAAIEAGAPLIYQAAFANDRWVGFPDFLVRKSSPDGQACYEPEDAKLARSPKAEHLLQLGIYASLAQESVGSPLSAGAIHVGVGEPKRFDLKRSAHITERLMRKFDAFAELQWRNTRPVKSAACAQCPFLPRCEAEWRDSDSPVFVAGIRGNQMIKLETAGIRTLTELANLDSSIAVPGIGSESLTKLVAQALLQKNGADRGEKIIEVLPPAPSRGFALLPRPAEGDLFFDMEGDPHYSDQDLTEIDWNPATSKGLEYLFGLWGPLAADGSDIFHPIWAHDRDAEKRAFQTLIRLFDEHLRRYPDAHIYHYAPYETAALKRLAMLHATMEAELDELLRGKRFVDLYQVVRQSIRASTEGYSLKDLEKIYWGQRSGEVTNAGDSIVEYERWRETGEQALLDSIGRYNKDDCVSTAHMRSWLESLRPAGVEFGLANDEPQAGAVDTSRSETRLAFEAERQALAAAVRATNGLSKATRDVISDLLWFHQRSQKPQWWALFDRQTWSDEELVEDFESLGGLTLDTEYPMYRDKRSFVATYRFSPQDTKLKPGDTCKIASTLAPAGTIAELDIDVGRVVVRRSITSGDFPQQCSLIPAKMIDQKVLVDAVVAFARRVAAGNVQGDQALIALLERDYPRLNGTVPGEAIVTTGPDIVSGVVDAVSRLDSSYLIVQGPPGTGKTYTTSKAILALLKAGKRIAVSSNSHKAIHNLLAAVEARAIEEGYCFKGAKKGTTGTAETIFTSQFITTVFQIEHIDSSQRLVGGTAFHFAQPEELGGYDYLFIDEAGQVALGNLVAMARCARNIVLVGDQMQLQLPVQGVHPGQSGLSCLDYLMLDHATVPPERGALLDVSWRMHPDVCEFISEAIYEGRLKSHPDTAERYLVLDSSAHPVLRPTGIAVLEVDHAGCTQSSIEEADAIASLLGSLLSHSLRDKDGKIRRLTLGDILIVSPFNAQVNLLRQKLPAGARVGTVDKFQGQEAAVAIVSMATSDGADAPRGSDFLFNINRLNVAVSRAQCLSVIVRSKQLLEMSPTSVADLHRLDGFARADNWHVNHTQ